MTNNPQREEPARSAETIPSGKFAKAICTAIAVLDGEGFYAEARVLEARGHLTAIASAEAENVILRQRIAVLLSALQDFEEYLDDKADYVDDDYGQPKANLEAALQGKIQLAILTATGGK